MKRQTSWLESNKAGNSHYEIFLQGNWAMAMVGVSQLLMVLFGDRLRFCQERRTRTLGPKCNLHILLSPEQTKHTQLNAFAFGRTQ